LEKICFTPSINANWIEIVEKFSDFVKLPLLLIRFWACNLSVKERF